LFSVQHSLFRNPGYKLLPVLFRIVVDTAFARA
jgi:hypothetical protein